MAWPSIIRGCLYVCICVRVFPRDTVCSRDRETSWKCVNLRYGAKTHAGTQRLTSTHSHANTNTHTHTQTRSHAHICTCTHFHETNISLHTRTKWGNRSKLFAYKLMKYYWVKLSWMLITKVMHYLLINESSLFLGKGWYKQVQVISVGTQRRVVVACARKNALLGSGPFAGGRSGGGGGGNRKEERRENPLLEGSLVDMVLSYLNVAGELKKALFI